MSCCDSKAMKTKKQTAKQNRLPLPEAIAACRLGVEATKLLLRPYSLGDLDQILHRLSLVREVCNDLSLHTEDLQELCSSTHRPVTRHLVSIECKQEAVAYLVQLRRLYFDILHFAKIGKASLRYTGQEDLSRERHEILIAARRSLGYAKNLYTFCKADWKILSRYLEAPELLAYSNWHWSQARRYCWLMKHKVRQVEYRLHAVRNVFVAAKTELTLQALSQELHDDLLVHMYQMRKVFEDLCRVLHVGRKRKTHYRINCTPSVGDLTLRENYKIFDNEYNEIRFSDLLISRIRDQKKAKRIAKKIRERIKKNA